MEECPVDAGQRGGELISIQEQCVIYDDLLPFFECPIADALGNTVCFEIRRFSPPFKLELW